MQTHPRIGVACVVERHGKVLIGMRKGAHGAGFWAFPGGHLELGETVEACAIRELVEETGLIATRSHLGFWVEDIMDNGTKHYITLFVHIDAFGGELTLKEPHKCEGWEWVTWDTLPSPLFPTVHSFLKKMKITHG